MRVALALSALVALAIAPSASGGCIKTISFRGDYYVPLDGALDAVEYRENDPRFAAVTGPRIGWGFNPRCDDTGPPPGPPPPPPNDVEVWAMRGVSPGFVVLARQTGGAHAERRPTPYARLVIDRPMLAAPVAWLPRVREAGSFLVFFAPGPNGVKSARLRVYRGLRLIARQLVTGSSVIAVRIPRTEVRAGRYRLRLGGPARRGRAVVAVDATLTIRGDVRMPGSAR